MVSNFYWRFGDKVYIETLSAKGAWIVLKHVGEEVTLVNSKREIISINGSFVHRWEW